MSAQRRYRFGPLEQRGVVGPLGIGQVAVVGVAAVLGLVGIYAMRSWAGLAFALIVLLGAVAVIYLPFEGRTLEQWAPIALRWALGTAERGRGYRSSAPGSGVDVVEGSTIFPVSLPSELAGLQMLEVPYGSDRVGVLHDRAAGTYTAALAVRAGAFSLLDGAEQERKLDGWGAVLAG